MKLKGIDLSGYNPVSSYAKVAKDNVDFVILKIIRKDLTPDKLFEKHWAGFEKNNVPIQGVYNYTYATTLTKFKSDAKKVISTLNGRKTMVWLDVEWEGLRGLGKKLIDGINAYAKVIQGSGLEFGVYTYLSFYNSYLKPYASELNFPFWIARYPSTASMTNEEDPNASKKPSIGKTLYGWQYASTGKVDGINGNVDLDEWYVNIEAKYVDNAVDKNKLYIAEGFKKDLMEDFKVKDGATDEDILKKTVTISSKKNKNHAAVTALERLLKAYGYYTGAIEEDKGKKPIFGNGMHKATLLYQANVVKLKKPDGEFTANNRSWRKAITGK